MSIVKEVQVHPIKPKSGLIAIASVLFKDSLFLSSIGIHRKLDGSGYRITYPTKKVAGRNIQIFHPTDRETGQAIEEAIVKRVEELI